MLDTYDMNSLALSSDNTVHYHIDRDETRDYIGWRQRMQLNDALVY